LEIKKTAIVILTYNKLDYTKACIDSIREYTSPGTYRLIVVDNLSTDGTRDWLAEQTDILTIFNEENVGFPKGCNQGIELAMNEDVLLLNNDILATENWLQLMQECLYSDPKIGAVGPISNSAYGDQDIEVSYANLTEMWHFANEYNRFTPSDWEQKLKLIGFCMLIRKEVIDEVGMLDEIFTPGMCEDSDYSFRVIQAGYKLVLCHNVFIHHFGSTSFGEMPEMRKALWEKNRKIFEEKWGFHTAYDTQSREDLLELIDIKKGRNIPLKVLDVGCACGATLLKAQYYWPDSERYGVEKNQHSAAIASQIANVSVGDAQSQDYPEEFYDYILVGDVLQELDNPWELIANLRRALKLEGQLILSIPNAAHYKLIFSLITGKALQANGEYSALKRHHLFTLSDIVAGLEQSGFSMVQYTAVTLPTSDSTNQFVNELGNLAGNENNEHLNILRYLVKVSKYSAFDMLQSKLQKFENETDIQQATEEIAELIRNGQTNSFDLIEAVRNSGHEDRQKTFNILVNHFYKKGLFDNIIPLLNASLEMGPEHYDTLYNYAFILHQVEADEQALPYIDRIKNEGAEAANLYMEIYQHLNKQ